MKPTLNVDKQVAPRAHSFGKLHIKGVLQKVVAKGVKFFFINFTE